jgi:tetratricopeptide (TPR) repeat protein
LDLSRQKDYIERQALLDQPPVAHNPLACAQGNARVDLPKYRAFISYSHRDSKWADWLHKALESYRPPKILIGSSTERGVVPKRLTPIFRDREELASATDLGTVISDALQQSACQIVICSPQAAKSRWVNEEIIAFKRLGREDRIFCLIIGGEPNASDLPGRAEEECFPPALRFRLGAQGQLSDARTEPIAADAREGKDGKQRAKIKLIAGVLGVGYDALRRREQQRRHRRLFALTCAAFAGMTVTSGLAGYALLQRTAARRQTVRAEAEAETAKQTTKFLVDLFTISDPSEARGNTVTAREMLDKGAARVDHGLAQQPAIQARLMDTLGSVYMGLGLYDQARPLLVRAVTTRRSLQLEDPLPLSESLSHLGDVLTRQAQLDAAEQVYREAIRVDSLRPKDPQSRMQLATSLYGFGVLLARQGRYEEAQKNLRDALARQQAIYGPVHPDVARTLKDLAQAVVDGGDPNAALPLMQSAVAMQRQLRGNEPHPDLAEALNDLALLYETRGDYEQAEKSFLESLAMERQLLGDKHPQIASTLENLASTFQDKGDLERAEPLYRQSLAMWRAVLGDTHPEVAMALHNLATLQYDRGKTREALANQRESLAIFRQVYPHDHPQVAFVLNQIGFWLTMSGDYTEADRDIHEALEMRRRLLGDHHPSIASSQVVLATLQVAQHRYPEALETAHSATEIYTTALSATHWRTAAAMSAQGAALTGLGRYSEAQPLLTRSETILSNKEGGAPPVFRTLNERYLEMLHRHEPLGSHVKLSSAATLGESSKSNVFPPAH